MYNVKIGITIITKNPVTLKEAVSLRNKLAGRKKNPQVMIETASSAAIPRRWQSGRRLVCRATTKEEKCVG